MHTELHNRILAEVERVSIVDTHEHLTLPFQLARMGRIDFGRLFTHYASCDLISAGMSPQEMAQVQRMDSDLSPAEKWRLVEPWYRRAWNTGYCECIRIAVRDLYGIEDLTDDTVEPLSEKMNAVPRESWTREVFDRSGIDVALGNVWDGSPVYPRTDYHDLFVYDMADDFTSLDFGYLSKDTDMPVGSLPEYLSVIDHYFEQYAYQASALKIGRAYNRTLAFQDVSRGWAERSFLQIVKGHPTNAERRSVEDFIVHYLMTKCEEYELPVKFHTGLQEGNCNDIRNSRAALLIPLFVQYPNVKFDIYHISWPYTEELANICKNFPNVWIDFCWAWIFNPPAARRCLSDMLETVPLTKIHGFGGDFIFVEGTYGHSRIARREIARVLSDKVTEGRFNEEYAVWAAQRLLRWNALEDFRVEEKRSL